METYWSITSLGSTSSIPGPLPSLLGNFGGDNAEGPEADLLLGVREVKAIKSQSQA